MAGFSKMGLKKESNCTQAWRFSGAGTYQASPGLMAKDSPTNSHILASVPVVSVSKQISDWAAKRLIKLACLSRVSAK